MPPPFFLAVFPLILDSSFMVTEEHTPPPDQALFLLILDRSLSVTPPATPPPTAVLPLLGPASARPPLRPGGAVDAASAVARPVLADPRRLVERDAPVDPAAHVLGQVA